MFMMKNDEIYKEIIEIRKRMADFERQKKFDERNALVATFRKLYQMYDFGFSVGETVHTIAWQNRWREAKIMEHREDNSFLVRNELGWEIYVPGFQIRKLDNIKIEWEQLSLF